MKKHSNILILNGHPNPESFNDGLANAYLQGAQASEATVSLLHIRDLAFDPNLQFGYQKRTKLEPDLLAAIAQIKAADHLVWVFPMWWYGYPAIMKGFIDRTFLPGITFDYQPGKALPQKLLRGKTARIILTADTPKWYDTLFMKSPTIHQFKKGTLEFCGVYPVKVTYIAPIKDSTEAFRQNWLSKVKQLGKNNK